jgi:hypothetical protein
VTSVELYYFLHPFRQTYHNPGKEKGATAGKRRKRTHNTNNTQKKITARFAEAMEPKNQKAIQKQIVTTKGQFSPQRIKDTQHKKK